MVSEKQATGKVNKKQVATGIAIAFHLSGLIAIGIFRSPLFISLTPLNLLVCAALIWWTQEKMNAGFIAFCIAAFAIGFFAEWVGVNTGILFGEYSYGAVLGPGWQGVPYLIGIQWMVVVYCVGICMAMLHNRLVERAEQESVQAFPRGWLAASIIADGALLALLFDWILEPVAMELGYWTWKDNEVPWINYASWWGVSALALVFFHFLPFRKHNIFAVHLLMIQGMFFLMLRTIFGFEI